MADDPKAMDGGERPPGPERSEGATNGDMKTKNESVREDRTTQQPHQQAKKPSKIKELWQKAGLDVTTVMMMFKGSLPPTIAIAMYQSSGVGQVYSTLGYLVAITSVLGMCIMPRGMFLQNM